jgi:NAD(P)-dependent dehydrogenase (short-subunit alcohol dehydrogenase family)
MTGFGLDGKVAVVTGGAGVLGSAMARGLACAGARVVILGHSQAKALAVAEELAECGYEALGVGVDVLDKGTLIDGQRLALERFGRIDILVNSAGGNRPEATTGPDRSFFDLPLDAMEAVVDLNLFGSIYPAQVLGRVMAEQHEGVILNISSMTALTPLTNVMAYSAAKAALTNFTRWLSVYMCKEYSPTIRVNALAPGFFLTHQNRYLLQDENGQPTKRGRTIMDHTPMGRYGEPQDLVGAAVFLCSDAARFITGVVLPVDGGFSAYSGV